MFAFTCHPEIAHGSWNAHLGTGCCIPGMFVVKYMYYVIAQIMHKLVLLNAAALF